MPVYAGGDIHKGDQVVRIEGREPGEARYPPLAHTITLNDLESGAPLAVMDGQVISAM